MPQTQYLKNEPSTLIPQNKAQIAVLKEFTQLNLTKDQAKGYV